MPLRVRMEWVVWRCLFIVYGYIYVHFNNATEQGS